MSTKAIIGIVAAIVVIGGGAWYLSYQSSQPGPEGIGNVERESNKGSGTYADLIGRAGSWKCTVTTTTEGAPSTGVVYVSDSKLRGDFVSQTDAGEVHSSMIQIDGYIYTWSDMMAQGMKLKVPSSTDPAVSEPSEVTYSEVDYDCGMWSVDASVFVPPSEVSFMEPGAFGVPEGMPQEMPTN